MFIFNTLPHKGSPLSATSSMPSSINNLRAGQCWYAGESEKQNLDRIRDRITFNSVMAKCWPTDIASTNSKWHISLRKLARPKNSVLKSFRIEVEGIRPPDIRQLLQYWDWNLNVGSFGNLNVVELDMVQPGA
ncbi:hypothetical protein Pyn_29494 [Prunus yedoensis var. nudiflora]|uniref:Uncharacterized protein n=1 Tax=Prunus yedoensis var. nudiflora TaxID=2094558 RepID=A0A314URY7_PRUYE|nr:hypothetical protein Pyn_29494 [Prunus yedoensis var. nudiflora]